MNKVHKINRICKKKEKRQTKKQKGLGLGGGLGQRPPHKGNMGKSDEIDCYCFAFCCCCCCCCCVVVADLVDVFVVVVVVGVLCFDYCCFFFADIMRCARDLARTLLKCSVVLAQIRGNLGAQKHQFWAWYPETPILGCFGAKTVPKTTTVRLLWWPCKVTLTSMFWSKIDPKNLTPEKL